VQAQRPGELPLIFRDHLNAGNVAGLMTDYYAPEATYAPVPGVALTGAELEAALGRLAGLGLPIEVAVRHLLECGDTALLVVDWELADAGMSGTATDVARRQPDGSWKCVIDNPHGGARAVDLRPEIAAALQGRTHRS
jgi:ketosteroid isomerase-like protein